MTRYLPSPDSDLQLQLMSYSHDSPPGAIRTTADQPPRGVAVIERMKKSAEESGRKVILCFDLKPRHHHSVVQAIRSPSDQCCHTSRLVFRVRDTPTCSVRTRLSLLPFSSTQQWIHLLLVYWILNISILVFFWCLDDWHKIPCA